MLSRLDLCLRTAALFLLAISAAACGVESEVADDAHVQDDGVGSKAQEIIGGTLATGDMAVVQLAVYGNQTFGLFCTGTLIAPQTILTAAHCVYAQGTTGVTYYAHFGSDGYNPAFTRQIVSQTRHPQFTQQGTFDIAVLKLISPMTNVTPIPINTTPLTQSDIGRNIRHVGFGVNTFVNGQPQSDGKKRQVTTPLRQLDSVLLESGATNPTQQTCSGDSGGPGFMVTAGSASERVAGVVAFGDQQCQINGYDTRVDAFASWVQSIYNQWEVAQCIEDGKCAANCSSPDIDCLCKADGACTAACPRPALDPDCPADCGEGNVCSLGNCPIPDPDCVAEGNTCTSSTQCKGRQCRTDPQHPQNYCTRTCTTTTECPSSMTCEGGFCTFIPKPERYAYTYCNPLTDYCLGGTMCVAQNVSDASSCQYPCQSNGTCAVPGELCVQGTSAQKFCKDPNAAPVQRPQVVLRRASVEAPAAATGCSATGSGAMLLLLAALSPLLRRRVV